MAPSYKLKYFNGRGRAEPIRLIFAYAKVPYEDVRIEKADWPKHKESMPWGQLPVLEVEGVQISQTKAIGRFLAKRHGLAGESSLEQAKCDEYVDVQDDINQEFGKWYRESDQGKKEALRKSMEQEVLPRFFSKFEEIIKKNGNGLLVGKKVTYADIFLMFLLENVGLCFPDADLSKFPSLVMHSHAMISLPGIEDWLEKRPETAF